MAKKTELFDDLLTILVIITVGYASYYGAVFSSSPNLLKELLGAWFIFLALSASDFFALDTIYYVTKKSAQRHDTVRSLKMGATVKRILGFMGRMLTPFAIILTALMSIYFFIVFIASAFLLTLSKTPMLYAVFSTTTIVYIMVMSYGILVWRYKKAHMIISSSC